MPEILAAGALFDDPPTADGAAAFLRSAGHHLLIADVTAFGRRPGRLGAYGCWTLTEPDNAPALATYARIAGHRADAVMFTWSAPSDEGR